jgi:hypothetical protein
MDEQIANRMEALRNWRKQAGLVMGVESDVILPRDVLFQIASANPKKLQDLTPLMADLPWRLEHFGPDILKALQH